MEHWSLPTCKAYILNTDRKTSASYFEDEETLTKKSTIAPKLESAAVEDLAHAQTAPASPARKAGATCVAVTSAPLTARAKERHLLRINMLPCWSLFSSVS